jgi:hypothetical protein
MKTPLRRLSVTALCLLQLPPLVLLITSCCNPTPWNIEISANTASSVRVDLVGVNQLDKAEWDGLAVDDYWKADNSVRKNADRLSFEVIDGKVNLADSKGDAAGITGLGTATATIPRSHPIWKKWLDRRDLGLVAIGQFPGGSSDRPDPRKKILPIFKQYWDADKGTLRLQVQDNRIQVLTPPSGKCTKMAF